MGWQNPAGRPLTEFEKLEMRASHALVGIPPGELADKMEKYENEREMWLARRNPFTRFCRALAYRVVRGLLLIDRVELYELAIAAAKLMNDARAHVQREDSYAQFCRLVGDNRAYRSFLYEHFPGELANADAMNQPLLDLTRLMLLRFKYGKDYALPGMPAKSAPSDAPGLEPEVSAVRAGEPA